ncbi:helix-turn-helix domain-containing protein [Oleidesulfovibrio sp.]|uniref:helix-turn-helix domain-containing protein n=1 Tax=Oleidesulfovibrio sp. TaxID=2909707 RepID=UPI003A84AD01
MNKGLQYYLNRFSPLSVTIAREMRGLTKKELAERIGKTPSAITKIEKGTINPDLETFFSLSRSLDVAPSFFAESMIHSKSIDMGHCHFRCSRSVPINLRSKAIRKGQIIANLLFILQEYGISYPINTIEDRVGYAATTYEIEEAALKLRVQFGLGTDPITNFTYTLEKNGVFVIYIEDADFQKVDAFSSWIDGVPFIFLCANKPMSRLRFDMAHELGHLILHDDVAEHSVKEEREANRFASAFLLPWMAFKEECPSRWSLNGFTHLKKRWKVSISALLYRAKELKILSESTYKRSMITLNTERIRNNEPGEPDREKPVIFSEAITLLTDVINSEELIEKCGIMRDELCDILLSQHVPKQLVSSMFEQTKKNASILSLFPGQTAKGGA